MLRDLRHAIRLLVQSKGWTLVVLLSLALGIGANATVFSAINGLLLRTLPVADPQTLVRFRWIGDNDMLTDVNDYGYSEKEGGLQITPTFSYDMFHTFRSSSRTLVDLFACAPEGQLNVVANGRAELASGFVASGNYFDVLGVRALIGRTFTPDDDRPSAAPVAVLSHGYWTRRFGADPHVIGTVLQINTVPVTVIGVTPPAFTGVQQVLTEARDITLPVALDPRFNFDSPTDRTRLSQPAWWWLQIMGRLKPGTTPDQVQGELDGLFHSSAREAWTSYLGSLPEPGRSAA